MLHALPWSFVTLGVLLLSVAKCAITLKMDQAGVAKT